MGGAGICGSRQTLTGRVSLEIMAEPSESDGLGLSLLGGGQDAIDGTANERNGGVPDNMEGVTIGFILGAFLEECKQAKLDWSLPGDQEAWRSRLERGHLSLTPLEGQTSARHFRVPGLFGDAENQYSGSFKLVQATVLGLADLKGLITRGLCRARGADRCERHCEARVGRRSNCW